MNEIEELIPYTTFHKPSKHMLVDMINWANKDRITTVLNYDDTIFTDPVALPEGSDMNTVIRFAKVKGYRVGPDTKEIQYNRLDIDQLSKVLVFAGEIEIPFSHEIKKVSDLLPALYEAFPVYLDKEDIVDHVLDLTVFNTNNKDFTGVPIVLKMSDSCIGYIGELKFNVVPKSFEITEVFETTSLRGFSYPRTYGLG